MTDHEIAGAMPLPGRRCTARAQASFTSNASLAEQGIARDLEDETIDDPETPFPKDSAEETNSDNSTIHSGVPDTSTNVSMVGSYRTPCTIAAGSRAVAAGPGPIPGRNATQAERGKAREEERSLLEENGMIPPEQSPKSGTIRRWLGNLIPCVFPSGQAKTSPARDGDSPGSSRDRRGQTATVETDPLLGKANLSYGSQDPPVTIDKQWEEAVLKGEIQTSWQREATILLRYSAPLILTFLLQYSLNVASVFAVGHLGEVELGAVSLASMTANITGYAVYQGLATSLDTLCAQAYGSGQKKLVGLQTQRMVIRPSDFKK